MFFHGVYTSLILQYLIKLRNVYYIFDCFLVFEVGFQQTCYTVSENESFARVTVEIMQSTIERNAVVEFVILNGSAIGMF